ncbi:MAG: endonuclease/exonuclease/phosphatase family protein [Planctomycetales bacterium]|nr:endonuclease/exonuclease/phosphatase family protein [Planctomycetales bacterium]
MKILACLFQAAVCLSFAAMVAGLFGKWHFLLDLGSHFRIQATVALLGAGFALHQLRKYHWSKFSLTAGLVLTLTLLPYFPRPQSEHSPAYRLLTMNVLSSNLRRDMVTRRIMDTNPDFIALLETNSEWIESLESALGERWPYNKSIPRSDNFGIAVFSKIPFSTCDVIEYKAALATPSIRATFRLSGGETLRLIAVHPLPPMNDAYWQSRNSLFEGMASDVSSHDASRTILTGDLNCTPWSPWFRRLLRDSSLRNSMNQSGLGISWLPARIAVLGLPIDHVLVGSRIVSHGRYLGAYAGSDHRPVIFDFSVNVDGSSAADGGSEVRGAKH